MSDQKRIPIGKNASARVSKDVSEETIKALERMVEIVQVHFISASGLHETDELLKFTNMSTNKNPTEAFDMFKSFFDHSDQPEDTHRVEIHDLSKPPRMPNEIDKWPAIIREFLNNRPALHGVEFIQKELTVPERNFLQSAVYGWILSGKFESDMEDITLDLVLDFTVLEKALIKYGITQREIIATQ